MATVTTYLNCPHCDGVIAVDRSEHKEFTNMLLCPLCHRNLFSMIEASEEEE